MGKRLHDNLNSSYFEAANRLKSKNSRQKIVAYVESYEDVFFWRQILSRFETNKVYFEVMLPTHINRLGRGKKAVLMQLMSNKVGKNMIACVDADYDYLMQGATPTSQEINSNPYIFHTYAYAIENLQCYAESLHNVCVAVTLNDHYIFDIEKYLADFSEAIFPLFVWSIWYYRTPNYNKFTITDFLRIVETGHFSFNNVGNIIKKVRQKVGRKVEQLQRINPNAHKSYAQVKNDLKQLGVTPKTTYLYIQGHHLFDKVVVPMMTKICEKLIKEREQEISSQSKHGTQRRNELTSYTNSVEDIVSMLKKNSGYMQSEQFQSLKADIEEFMQSFENSMHDKDSRQKEEDISTY